MKNNLRLVRSGGLLFELITPLRRSRIALLVCALVLMALCCFLLIDGCSKSNGPTAPSTPALLQGNQAFHASTVAEYQSLGAGVSYPFAALKIASPTGSSIQSLSVANLLSHSHSSPALKRASKLTGTLTFVPALNLYADLDLSSIFKGNGIVMMNYYSDAAGTQSAGSVTITLPTSVTNLANFTFSSYPDTIPIAINITGGSLPCKGNIVIIFTDGTGANSMTGTNTLTKDNVVFNLYLTLDNNMNVSGSITITESGATLQLTNVQGNLKDPLTCDVKVSPYGWTGTGTLNLMTGSMTANVNTGTGLSTATSDSLGSLNINYADGTHEIVVNALSGSLTGGSTPGGSSTTSYNAPLIYIAGQRTITAINNKGQSIGYLGYNATPVNWTTPTAQAETLHVPAGYMLVTPASLNDNNQIVGSGSEFNGPQNVALYWSSPTAQAQKLALPDSTTSSIASSINNSGQIVGWADNWTNSSGWSQYALYWTSPTDTIPKVLQQLAGGAATDFAAGAAFISSNGQIIGGWNGKTHNYLEAEPFWVSPNDPPVALSFLSGDSYANPMSVNAAGVIVGYSGWQRAVTWAGATKAAKALPLLSGSASGYAASINTAGVIVGGGGSIYDDGVIWQTNGQVQDLNTLIPSGNSYTLGGASLITDQGWILGTAENKNNPNLNGQYILIPK